MGKVPANSDENTDGLKKGPWSAEEDEKLIDYIKKHGHGRWRTLPKNAGLRRCGKSCRLRWTNYLRPDIKRGRFSPEEEESIIQLHSVLGNKWSAIAARLPGRTDNEIKNYWNTHIKKRLLRMGIDPVTHAPHVDLLELSSFLYNYAHDPNFLAMVGTASPDLNLLDLAAQYFSKPKTQELVLSHQNPQETSPYYLSELQNHIQTLIQSQLHNQNQLNGEQNPSHQNSNFLINSQNYCVPNSWYPETTLSSSAPVIANSAYFGSADKNYYPCGSDNVHELSPSPMASSGGTLNSSSITMTYGGGGINNGEERDSHRSNCFMFDILNGSYINSIM